MPEVDENGPVSFTPVAHSVRWTGDTLVIADFLETHCGDSATKVVDGRLYILGGDIPFIMNDGWWLIAYLGSLTQVSPEKYARMHGIPVKLILP